LSVALNSIRIPHSLQIRFRPTVETQWLLTELAFDLANEEDVEKFTRDCGIAFADGSEGKLIDTKKTLPNVLLRAKKLESKGTDSELEEPADW
jgi:hypothetical protein